MKNFFRFLLMSLFLATSFSVACSDDDDNPAASDNSIVGTWILIDDEEESITIRFNPDGTGSLDYLSDWEDETQRFEYVYRPEEHYLEIINSILYGEYKVTVSNSILKLKDVYSSYSLTFTRQ